MLLWGFLISLTLTNCHTGTSKLSRGPRMVFFKGDSIVVPESVIYTPDFAGVVLRGRVISVTPKLAESKSLQRIVIEDSSLTKIPNSIYNLERLEYLSIETKRVSFDSSKTAYWKNLQLSLALGKLKNLQVLSLPSNLIKQLPPTIGQLKKLKKLNLIGNELERLPSEFSQLESLIELDLNYNHFKTFPEVLLTLPRIKKLSISVYHNNIKADSIRQLYAQRQGGRHVNVLIGNDSRKEQDEFEKSFGKMHKEVKNLNDSIKRAKKK